VYSRQGLHRDAYLERHHIIPKGIFGSGILDESHLEHYDDSVNLVLLTGREHFVAHWLLHRAFPKNKNLAAAFHAMATMSNKYHFRYTPSSRAVEEARKVYADLQKLPVAMYSLQGELLKIFKTTNDAAIHVDNNVHNIAAACNIENNVNSIKGYQWRRFDKVALKKIEPYINKNDDSSLKVHEYDLLGSYIKTHDSIREAGRNNIDRSALKTKKRGNPIFVNDKWILITTKIPPQKITVKKTATQRRLVHQIDPDTGEIINTWNSTREVQRELGISNVSSVCNGKRKTMGGFIWKYSENDYELNLDNHKPKLPRATEISVYLHGQLLGTFPSIRKAELATNIKRLILSRILKLNITENGIKVIQV